MALTRKQVNAVEQEFNAWMKDGSHIRLMTLAHHVSFLVDTIKEKDKENQRMHKVLEKTKAEIQTAIDDCEMETIRATQHAKFILKLLQIDLADIDAGSGVNVEEGGDCD